MVSARFYFIGSLNLFQSLFCDNIYDFNSLPYICSNNECDDLTEIFPNIKEIFYNKVSL